MQKFILILIAITILPALSHGKQYIYHTDSISQERSGNIPFLPQLGIRLIIAGSILRIDHSGSRLRTDYKPAFQYKCDEVLRFVPALALVGMKAFGVESRTPWGRMIISDIFATAIMGASVESTKRLTKRIRPDGSNDRSFPSGHTAAAFMTATMFAKEYGYKSPWYSVGAYAVATSTAMLRRINDHHWLSDVMTGAGIGVLSTELGYWITDIIYKDTQGRKRITSRTYDKSYNPSFAGLYLEYSLPSAILGYVEGQHIESNYGYNVGMEAAKFFNPYLGIGGRMSMCSMQLKVNGFKQDRALDNVSISIGPYFSYPLFNRFLVGATLRLSYSFYPKCEFEESGLVLGGRSGWGSSTGISLTYLNKRNMAFRLLADYDQWTTAYKSSNLKIHPWSIGFGMNWAL